VSTPVTVLILPGGDPDGLPLTVADFRSELGEGVEVLALAGPDLDGERAAAAGIPLADPGAIAGTGRILAFARAADRLVPGALEARLRTFSPHREIGLQIAGHVLVGDDGAEVRRVGPPVPGSDPDDLLIRRTAEAAAVLARAESLDLTHLQLLSRPFGDIVVWSRVAHDSGFTISGESAAEVRLDPARHGYAPEVWIGQLLETVSAAEGPDRPGESSTRRELLRRLYLTGEEPPEPVDLAAVFAGKLRPEGATGAVIADLQWIAERQSEALRLERLRWAEGEVAEAEIPSLTISEEIIEAQSKLSEVGASMAQMQSGARRLEAEIYRRDAIISDLENLTHAEAHERGAAPAGGEDAE